jgi:MraZ protein
MSSFIGSEVSAIDVKGRMNVPARLRKGLSPDAADSFTIVCGPDGCINMYPHDEWQRFAEDLRSLSLGDEVARKFFRVLSDSAHETTIDGQGRVSLTPKLRALAGIDGQAKLVGAIDHIELWDPKRFEASVGSVGPSFEEMLQKLLGKKSSP